MRSGTSLLLGLLLACASPVSATQWVTLGPRAMGMGGAFVAVAEGPLGAYYNPGALGRIVENPTGVVMTGSGRYEVSGNILEGANDFYEIAKQCRSAGAGGLCSNSNLATAAAKMQNPGGEGALAEAGGGLNFKFGRLAVFANNFSFRGITPEVSATNTTANVIDFSNTTKLHVRGASFYEFGVGYGREILETGLFLGGNAKGIVARTGYTDFFVARENPEPGNVFRNYDRSTTVSFMPGIDVGLLWDVRETFPDAWMHPRVGFVGRNVNAPRFSLPARADQLRDSHRFYSLQGQSRVGFAFDPLRWWTISTDLDLTENLTMVERYTSRLYAAGTEIRLFNEPGFSIPIRGGVSKNLVEGHSGTVWSMGVGIQAINFYMDIAAQIPERWHRVQSVGGVERIPHQLGLAAQFAVLFGGADSIAEPGRDPFAPTPSKLPKAPVRPSQRDPFRR
ncbi:MAG: conjugal transfer protein TraF [Elusimicrobia bacterium]|nr:conjugal transfer protein TraF [Elusimicrobiota bacterium]